MFSLFPAVFHPPFCPFQLFFLVPFLFSPSLFIHIFSGLPCCFPFKSAILCFLFSYHSLLSASPFCSISIQSILFLLFFIFWVLFLCFFFLLLLYLFSLSTFFFSKDPMILLFSFVFFSLFLFHLFSFCSFGFLCFLLTLFLFFSFVFCQFSYFLFAVPFLFP